MEKLQMHSKDLTQRNIAHIRELFPNCVTETQGKNDRIELAVDFELLRQELSESIVEGQQERYQLVWPGKREALLKANAPVKKTLRPDRDESLDFDNTRNLFIEADNLDALKLLQETYLGKIKAIYIDPPYNTGHDFIYEDNYSIEKLAYEIRDGVSDPNGNKLFSEERWKQNSSSNGRFHSDWISMMYSRLKLARHLLRDDGVIFISIDDGEVHNLRKICDEIFGETNFIVNAIWRSKDNSNNDAKRFSIDHNHTLVYAKDNNWEPAKLSDDSKRGHFKNPDNDPNGPYFDGNPLNSPNYRENLIYPLVSPQGIEIQPPKNGWRWSEKVMHEKISSGEIRFTPDGTGIRRRTYLKDMKGLPPSSLWIDLEKTGHNRQAKYELLKLLPEDVFDTPKPVKLIDYILRLSDCDEAAIVMDFFAGSATTAHAVMQLNAEDGLNRRFIMVQLPEPCDSKSDAFKAGYHSITDISKERIRRAGKEILSKECDPNWNRDIGFRVLKVDSSNLSEVHYAPDEVEQTQLDLFTESIKSDRSPEDLLFQVLLNWGVDLSLPITKKSISNRDVFFVDENALVACFDKDIDENLVRELTHFEPLRVVFRDDGFVSDAVKINVEQIFRQLSPGTEVKSI